MSLSHLAVLVFGHSFLGAQICNCFFSQAVLDDQVFCLSDNGILISIGVNDNLFNLDNLLSGCLTRCLVSLVMLNILNSTLLQGVLILCCMSFGSLSFSGILCWYIFPCREVPNAGCRWYRRLIRPLSDLCSMLRLTY